MTLLKRILFLIGVAVVVSAVVSCGNGRDEQGSKSEIQQIKERDRGFGTSKETEAKIASKQKEKAFKGRRISQVTLLPEKPNIYSPLSVQAKVVSDGLQNPTLNYIFWRNSRLLKKGKENSVPAYSYKKGEIVYVDVILMADGKEIERKRSKTFVFLNSRPRITDIVFPDIRGNGTYRIMVKTLNPDNDPLTFSIQGKNLPPGLDIDQKTGVITYRLDDVPEQDLKFEVVVRDNDGGKDHREVTIKFSKQTELE